MGAAREATTGPSSPCWAVGGNLALRAGGDGMVELPRGTVTFLLTDVEGSSALWEAAPDAMHAALTRHDLLFEETVRAHRGVHVRPRGEGDSRFAVFASAVGAVAAAVTFQRALASEAWLLPRPLAVRIGIHTGHAELRDGDYYGSAVNRCARVRDVGRGTQTILSDATVAVVRDDLPNDLALRDLGERRLKGLSRADRLSLLLDGPAAAAAAAGTADSRVSRARRLLTRSRQRLVSTATVACVAMVGVAALLLPWLKHAEVVLLSDDFDLAALRALPEASDFPNEFAVGYSGGEYTVQTIAQSQARLPSAILPGWYADATLAVDARVLGDPESQLIVVGCRNSAPRSGYRLTLRPSHGTGSLDRTDDVPVLVRLAPLSNSGAVRRRVAMNHIELRCVADSITAAVNGTTVASVHDTTYPAGRM
jgi:class 3 adenylate cyclase